jgi:adenine-specific DNA-methyltransferase
MCAPTAPCPRPHACASILDRYTARNTFDYFIHKDLGGFLRRELDFYIKNEVMHLDDVESESAPRVEQYLSKIKVIRRIAHKIIDFLSQLEDFQKKLWLKKKFVVETQYCVTLDRIFAIQDEIMRQGLIHEIIENYAQREEWVRLFAIDEISVDLTKPGYSSPLTTEFLKANPYLALDTRHFPEDFKLRLLASFDDLDRQCDGLLIHSENFQALSLLRGRYYQQICCVYNDPPYNTEADRSSGKFLYKDGYERSSWISFLYDRIHQTLPLLADDALFLVSIDEHEFGRLNELLGRLLQTRVGVFTWVKKAKGSHLSQTIRDMTEFVLAYCRVKDGLVLYGEAAYSEKTQPLAKKTNARKTLKFPPRCVSTKLADGKYQAGKRGEGDSALTFIEPFEVANGIVTTKIVVEGPFVWTQEKLCKELKLGTIPLLSGQFGFNVMRHDQAKKFKRPSTLLSSEQGIGTNETAFQEYASLFGIEPRGLYPKPVSLISYLIQARTFFSKEGLILDAFAGSGSTAHAVINLNREDSGRRKYILVEMGEYFDTVLVPRIKKAVYSKDWKDGKPVSRAGISHMFKYVRLESYEDTLNNLELRRTQVQQSLLDHPQAQGPDRLKEQYLLRYMLDVESRGSPSLLNVKAFDDPTAYAFKVKRPGSDESRVMNVDLIETFNWLIGLRVQHLAAPQTFSAEFEHDTEGRLRLKGQLMQIAPHPGPLPANGEREKIVWWFRTVTGTTPDGRKTLIIWRTRPGGESLKGIEQDNLVLDAWFTKQDYSSKDSKFDLIYVNGGNNLENLKAPDDTWKVRLIEEDFFRLMFETEGV